MSWKSGRQEHEGRKRKYVIRIMEGESERVKMDERERSQGLTGRRGQECKRLLRRRDREQSSGREKETER